MFHDFPIETPIFSGFPIAIFDCRRVVGNLNPRKRKFWHFGKTLPMPHTSKSNGNSLVIVILSDQKQRPWFSVDFLRVIISSAYVFYCPSLRSIPGPKIQKCFTHMLHNHGASMYLVTIKSRCNFIPASRSLSTDLRNMHWTCEYKYEDMFLIMWVVYQQ